MDKLKRVQGDAIHTQNVGEGTVGQAAVVQTRVGGLKRVHGDSVHVQSISGDNLHRAKLAESGGGIFIADYELLRNKPSIESVTLIGNKTFAELGMIHITNLELALLLTL